MALEVTAVEEITIMEHLDIFQQNGFHFKVDDSAEPTNKLKLAALPFSKGTQFGVSGTVVNQRRFSIFVHCFLLQDVHELASILAETPGKLCRLPKARAMFASRACRSAVMIGTAMSHEEMSKLVKKMSGLEQPWNCPHGYSTIEQEPEHRLTHVAVCLVLRRRPTMRHLADLQLGT